uniref:Protein kinase domain-containing protein n=1 Tax=Knipowitschia caucasica TaxID=637954 RepID=A0AAV2K7K1_KNICA
MKWFQRLVKAKGSIPSGSNSYQVQKILGSGSYGTVALCRKNNADQKVALKVVKNPDREGPLMEYLSTFGSASHHIVQWFCSFNFNGHVCHEYEVLDISLGDFLKTSSTLPLHHIRPILTQMAEALKFLKSVKLIHGDLKPANIMLVDRVGKPFQVKIVDFGLARPARLAKQGRFFGTRCYSTPEMAVGAPVHYALDMWSLGCIAAKMFLGQRLFSARNSCELSSCVSVEMKRPGSIGKLEDIFMMNPHGCGDLHLFVDLMKRLLDMDPDSRIDPQEVLDHPFISPSLLLQSLPIVQDAPALEILGAQNTAPHLVLYHLRHHWFLVPQHRTISLILQSLPIVQDALKILGAKNPTRQLVLYHLRHIWFRVPQHRTTNLAPLGNRRQEVGLQWINHSSQTQAHALTSVKKEVDTSSVPSRMCVCAIMQIF